LNGIRALDCCKSQGGGRRKKKKGGLTPINWLVLRNLSEGKNGVKKKKTLLKEKSEAALGNGRAGERANPG